MLSIADLKIAVTGLDYVPSALGKSDEKKLIISKLDRTFLSLVLLKYK